MCTAVVLFKASNLISLILRSVVKQRDSLVKAPASGQNSSSQHSRSIFFCSYVIHKAEQVNHGVWPSGSASCVSGHKSFKSISFSHEEPSQGCATYPKFINARVTAYRRKIPKLNKVFWSLCIWEMELYWPGWQQTTQMVQREAGEWKYMLVDVQMPNVDVPVQVKCSQGSLKCSMFK